MYIFSCSVASLKWLWLDPNSLVLPTSTSNICRENWAFTWSGLCPLKVQHSLSKFSSDLLPVSCWEKHQALYLIMFIFPAVNFLLCLPAVCSVLQYFYQIYWTFQLFQPNLTPFHFFTVHKCSVFTWSFATKLVFNILDEQAFPPLATDRLCSSSPLLSCELGFLASSTCSTNHPKVSRSITFISGNGTFFR